MVEGTLVSRMACSFAGSRRSGDLGRSVSFVVGLLPYGRSRRRQRGVSWSPRRGTSSAYANQGVRTRAGRHRPSRARGRVLRSVQEPAHRHGRSRPLAADCGNAGCPRKARAARDAARQLGCTTERARFDVGQTGETRRNRRRDWVVRMLRGSPRVSPPPRASARRARRLMRQNRDGGCGLLPRTRGHVEPRPSGRTSWQLQKSSGVVGSRIRSRNGPRKGVPRE